MSVEASLINFCIALACVAIPYPLTDDVTTLQVFDFASFDVQYFLIRSRRKSE
jgi:hypothetical protein